MGISKNPSGFWKKHTLQTGLLIIPTIRQSAGSTGNSTHLLNPALVIITKAYALTKIQQFFGANLGLNRRLRLGRDVNFLVGLHAQGSGLLCSTKMG